MGHGWSRNRCLPKRWFEPRSLVSSGFETRVGQDAVTWSDHQTRIDVSATNTLPDAYLLY